MKSTLKIVLFLCLLYATYQGSFQCNVAGCQYCSYPNFCGSCQPNYLLVWSNSTNTFSCNQLTCPTNCATCYMNNSCQVCSSGYFLTQNGTCVPDKSSASTLPPNCLWGNGLENCTLCEYGYSLQAGFCYLTIKKSPSDSNCLIQQAPMICQICNQNYLVGPLGSCISISQINQTSCNVQNCAYCTLANSTCEYCMSGFQLTSQNTCTNNTCNVQGCGTCGNDGQCSGCILGYVYNSQSKTCQSVGYGCNDVNCLVCDSPQSCGQCAPGFTVMSIALNGVTVKVCRPLSCPYTIQNCAKCTYQYNTLFNYQKVLCAQCNPNYVLVNGYCVAQLTTYPCSTVANCAACSFNNFCSQCNNGYILSSLGTCIPTQCTNVPNCASCSANYVCQQCNSGYTLSLGFMSLQSQPLSVSSILTAQCIPTGITCNVSNCAYCKSNNACAACFSGYDFSSSGSNVCSPTCSISNCYQCQQGNQNLCLTCSPGYSVSSNGASCSQISYSCTGCSSYNGTICYYNPSTSQGVCTQCSPGNLLYQGKCYTSSCNIYGCAQCQTWTSPPVCLKCNQGLILGNGYCQQLNCNNGVTHCNLCIQNNICLGCEKGYLLVNSTGTPSCVAQNTTCSDPNCLQCTSGGAACTKCAMPYNVSNGVCVCGFQNCLSCSTSGITCDSCPAPLFSNIYTQGCVPAPSLKRGCNVSDCEYCLTANQCSVCAVGYSLNPTSLTCTWNNCSSLGLANCSICDSIGYLCHECNAGFMVDNLLEGGKCAPINPGYTCNISGCDVCSSTNNSICAACLPTYFANGTTQCLPNTCNIANCYLCLQSNICSQCITGFYLTVNSNNQQSCQPTANNLTNCAGTITNCAMCVVNLVNSNNQNYCVQCNDGFEFDSTNSVCVPNSNSIPNCKIQANYGPYVPPFCIVCEQGYFINTYGLCSAYNPATNNTNCSVTGCLYCGLNSTQCSFCFVPWGISSSGLCISSSNCSANCQFCTNSSVCMTCITGYTLNAPNTCVQCQVTNCQLCQQTNICATCTFGYSLTSIGTCLTCNIPGCTNCSSINICSTCANTTVGVAEYPSPTGDACYPCDKTLTNMANCISCSGTNSCGLCSTGYQVYSPSSGANSVCIQCSIQNCQTCGLSGNTIICQTCLTGYSLNAGSCLQCLYPCLSCNSNQAPNNCVKCSTPFYLTNAAANGTCIVNLIPFCTGFNPVNTSQCQTCMSGYTYNSSSNACDFNCPNNCQTCQSPPSPQSPKVCTQCAIGFYLPSNGTCTQCQITGCDVCSADGMSCVTCSAQGFYQIENQCRICPGYCSTCSSNTSCTALVQSNQQVLVTINSTVYLAVCQQNCISCSNLNPQACLQCANGFYLQNGNCFACSSNCQSCNSTNQDQCLSCYPNNFLSGSICSSCSPTCRTCQSSNQPSLCTSCFDGYYLANSTCVQGCPQNCLACSAGTTCTQCLSGYTLFTQSSQLICAPCTTSCRTCAEGQPASCLSCGIGFYLSGVNCVQCSTNCKNCNAAGCTSCIDGFFLTSTQSCSPNCILPCATCSAITPTVCRSCIVGYSYNDVSNTCNQVITCNGPCQVCPLGYTLNLGRCIKCTANQCQSCNPSTPSQCYSCLPGYFLNPANSQCKACSASCQTCLSATGCTTCATGYTRIQGAPMTSSGYQCVACNYPCATCLNTPNYCTSCVSGYQFFGWKCAQSFYFGFQVTLLVNMTTFNLNYFSFLTVLSNAVGATTTNAITITSIVPGSVVVQGGAGPTAGSGSKQANQQYSSLDATLSTNNQIAGMPIGQSSVTVVGGTVDYKEVNLALILGICIPVAVLLIAGIVLYIYCKKKRSAEVIQQKIKEDSGFTVRQSFELSTHYKDEDTQRPFEQTTAIN